MKGSEKYTNDIHVAPKLTISEIINEAVGDAKVDDPTDYALTNGNFSAKLYTTKNSEPFSFENDEPLNTALGFNPSIKYLNFTVNIDTNHAVWEETFVCRLMFTYFVV
jgi:hypothetical protein